MVTGLKARDEYSQVNGLLYTKGDESDDILATFDLSAEEKKNYEVVKEKFNYYFVKRRNVIFEHVKFDKRKQEEGKSVDSLVTDLYVLAKYCNYGAPHDERI